MPLLTLAHAVYVQSQLLQLLPAPLGRQHVPAADQVSGYPPDTRPPMVLGSLCHALNVTQFAVKGGGQNVKEEYKHANAMSQRYKRNEL